MVVLSSSAAGANRNSVTVMTMPVSPKILLICAWCGPATVGIALVGWLIAGVLPIPLGASSSLEEVVGFYSSGVHVSLGLAISSIGVCMVIPLIAGITGIMRERETGTPLLTLIQLISGTATALCLLFPMLIMAVAGFRPERSPELTMTLNDLAWLLFITPIAPFIIQNLAIAALALGRSSPLLPRWIGFLNLWVGFSFSFDIMAYAFKSGPLAWNGLLIFWLALTTYSIWLLAMGLHLRRLALSAQEKGV
jgi:hypothetical protein